MADIAQVVREITELCGREPGIVEGELIRWDTNVTSGVPTSPDTHSEDPHCNIELLNRLSLAIGPKVNQDLVPKLRAIAESHGLELV